MREQVAGNDMAWLAPAGDAEALARAIAAALGLAPDLRARLAGEAAHGIPPRHAPSPMSAATAPVARAPL